MRSIEEQMQDINRRKDVYKTMKTLTKKIIAEVISSCVCVAMMITVIYFLPEIRQASEQAPIRQYGSMVLTVSTVGYILIAILSFILGVVFTVLCQHWKQRKEKEREIE